MMSLDDAVETHVTSSLSVTCLGLKTQLLRIKSDGKNKQHMQVIMENGKMTMEKLKSCHLSKSESL
jgi:hypothetical protein